jgi:hypothetical protein
MILHLGVVDVPYVQALSRRQKKARAGTVTTGDVATWLENRYGVMETFFASRGEQIADDLAGALGGTLESFMMGAPPSIDPFGSATSSIEDQFKQFLATGEMEMLGVAGVPTQAALERRAGRRRSGRMKRRRAGTGVSFIDTGLYQSSFKAWID